MSKAKRLISTAAVLLGTAALTGCSGINATRSISPATFLLPGLVQHGDLAPATTAAPVERIALLSDSRN